MSSSIIFIFILVIFFISNSSNYAQSLYQQILSMVDSVSTENLTNHIQWLEEPGGENSRVNFTAGNDSASVYIKNEFDKISGLTTVEFDTFYIPSANPPLNLKPMVNVVATLEGTANPNMYFVIGAHLDCSASRMGQSIWNSQWSTITAPGADDNATGIAAILEIARILADPANYFDHAVTLKFIAFGAEELGPAYSGSHHGSRHYAKYAKENNHNVLGMVSIDMIGYNPSFDYQSIVSNNASVSFAEQFIHANDIFSIDLILEGPPFPYGTYSDHDTFWDEGYPAVLFIENGPPWNSNQYYSANPYYHKSTDTYETLNMDLVTKVTKLNLAAFAAFSGPLTDVAETENTIPEEFSLSQNYPNPFNPTTKISFTVQSYTHPSIPSRAMPVGRQEGRERSDRGVLVTLKVYDILGNEIDVLVEEQKSPGTYEVEFSGRGLTSGVYFYRLTAGDFSITKQMMLVK
ncbi:MAG: M20/M25/M40 family metallo-hydrolase [Ignavibacteriae bacterium]|nr:M20/M25/M40 family metallo-hydrolase [Ignavibacteriota bacterium]